MQLAGQVIRAHIKGAFGAWSQHASYCIMSEDNKLFKKTAAVYARLARDVIGYSLALPKETYLISRVVHEKSTFMGNVIRNISVDVAHRIIGSQDKEVSHMIYHHMPVFISMENQLVNNEVKGKLVVDLDNKFEIELRAQQRAMLKEASEAEDACDGHHMYIAARFMSDCVAWDNQLIPMTASYMVENMPEYQEQSSEDEDGDDYGDDDDEDDNKDPEEFLADLYNKPEPEPKQRTVAKNKKLQAVPQNNSPENKKHMQIPYHLCISATVIEAALLELEKEHWDLARELKLPFKRGAILDNTESRIVGRNFESTREEFVWNAYNMQHVMAATIPATTIQQKQQQGQKRPKSKQGLPGSSNAVPYTTKKPAANGGDTRNVVWRK